MYLPRLLALILTVTGLAGCATAPTPPAPPPPRAAADPVSVAIAQSASLIAQSVLEMKQVTTAVNLPDITPNRKAQIDAQQASIPAGLTLKISTDYDGVFTTLVEGIAGSVGWSYHIEGNKPPMLQVIHKKYNQVRAIDALRDLGYSIHGASIVLDPPNKRIIVRF
jgi:hypothetical protein